MIKNTTCARYWINTSNGCGYSGPDKLQDGCWGEFVSRVIEQAYWSVRLLYSPAKRFLRSVPCIWCTHSHLIITLLSWHWQTVQLKTLISSFRRGTFSKRVFPPGGPAALAVMNFDLCRCTDAIESEVGDSCRSDPRFRLEESGVPWKSFCLGDFGPNCIFISKQRKHFEIRTRPETRNVP